MTRGDTIRRFLRCYGSAVKAGGGDAYAIIRPLQYKSGSNLGLPPEYYDDLHYLYTGSVDKKLDAGNIVTLAGEEYTVRRAGTTVLGGEELYVWAVLKACPSDAVTQITLLSNNSISGFASGYTARISHSCGAVRPWGEEAPVAAVSGTVSYLLTLKNVRPQNGADLASLSDFSVTIQQAAEKTTYSGCRIQTLTYSGEQFGTPLYGMELLAISRTRDKEAQDNGS